MQTATPVPGLVVPEARRLAYLAKSSLRVVLLLGAMVALASRSTAAPVVFEASGEFNDGRKLSGTVTIDTATGKVLSADLSVTFGSVEIYVFDGSVSVLRPGGGPYRYTTIEFGPGTGEGYALLYITLPGTSLVGYDGSEIYPPKLENSGAYFGDYFVPLSYCSLEPN
jgi:hypothetical protein